VGHEGWLTPAAKLPASGMVSFPQRLGESSVNEEAAKIFVAEIDRLQPDG
jgi:hypothetical protein